jgi:hypothetical protein
VNIGRNTLRDNLKMTVHRGGVGNRPNRLSETHPVGSEQLALIKSGSVMTLDSQDDTLKWKAGGGGSVTGQFYFAKDDANQGDVMAAGALEGLSCLEAYQLGISQFVTDSYTAGDKLVPSSTAPGKVEKLDEDVGGYVVAVVALDLVAPITLAPTIGQQDPSDENGDPIPGGASPGVEGGVYVVGRDHTASNLEQLRINTVQPYYVEPAGS